MSDLIQVLIDQKSDERIETILQLPISTAAHLLENLHDEVARKILISLDPSRAVQILESMISDEKVDLLQGMNTEERENLLDHFAQKKANELRILISYQNTSAGGMMQVEVNTVRPDQSASDIIRNIQSDYAKGGHYHDYFVVDQKNKLVGKVGLGELLTRSDDHVSKSMDREPKSVHAKASFDEVYGAFQTYDLETLPVTSRDQELLGVITRRDVMMASEEKLELDFQKFTGVSGNEESREMPLKKRFLKRMPWSSINILLNFLAASVIAMYETTLQEFVYLAVFLPIISDMSGCSGNQAVALSIRELSKNRLNVKKGLWVLYKEWLMGISNGLVIGCLLGLMAYLWKGHLALSLLVAFSLYINTIISVCLGGVIPILLKKYGRDPAISSSPILTTITDMMGFMILLSLASIFSDYLRM